ncbi:MAG: Mur ligase family protein, partial [Chloroflexota bacterium]|nr:Mur ligase family protein [Chloroflexota bacterium]
MTLGSLLRSFEERTGLAVPIAPSAERATVAGVTYDSRQVKPGWVFVALQGLRADGTAFVRDAARRGAAAIVAETDAPSDLQTMWISVPDARLALAALAAICHGDPSERLLLVGITGTNGKTTTSYLIESIFEAAGIPCGRIGTVGYRIGRSEISGERTTPEAPELQAMLRQMLAQGCGACAMEVSSHALALKRA